MDVNKTHLPTQEAPPRACAWLLQPHEYYRRSEGLEGAPRSGSQAPERVGFLFWQSECPIPSGVLIEAPVSVE